MKSGRLTQVSVSIAQESEEAVSVLFENLLGQTPSIYVDAQTGATTATVYLDKTDKFLSNQIKSGLTQIAKGGLDIGTGKISIKNLPRENWAESWKKHFKPIGVGNVLLVKPSWSKRKPKRHQAVVILDPGLSFGTGQHATTLFCLQQLVAFKGKSQSFLDIGTGSGILAISAAKLGYGPVQAFDFDPESVRVSRANVKQNKVTHKVRPEHADLTKLPLRTRNRFDLICANLIYDLLLQQSNRILNRLKPGGNLVLAGILITQFQQVQRCYEQFGLKLVATEKNGEWQSGTFHLGS
jgi:ribosomal protein L11 methyltransferase